MTTRRILVDVTYTRLQQSAVGINRTVLRLAQELPSAAVRNGASVSYVAFDGHGFRYVNTPAAASRGPTKPALLRVATGMLKGPIEQLLRLPWRLVRPFWALASGLAFRQAVKTNPRIEFGPGDLLFIVDGSWNYAVDRGTAQARRAGAAVVTVIYDLMPLEEPQYCVAWVRSAFADWLSRSVAQSDALMCISRHCSDRVRVEAARRGWKLPPIDHFRLGCDPAPSSPDPVRAELREFMQGPRCYASVGSIEPKKNHETLLAAFEQLWASGTDARLLVIGRRTSECRDIVQRLARHAPDRVMLLHDASDAEVAYAYEHCRALVLPTRYEGFGLPLVEARTRGAPVFASDLPCFREVADGGVHWFDPREPAQLARLLVADGAGELALARSAMPAFTWRDSAVQCIERLDALLGVRIADVGRGHGAAGAPFAQGGY